MSKPQLKPAWKPGQSGNPKGRPPYAKTLTSLLRDEIEKICPQDREKRTWYQLIVLATMQLAIKGNPTALKEVWERLDGKVKQDLGLTGADGGPIDINIAHDARIQIAGRLAGIAARQRAPEDTRLSE